MALLEIVEQKSREVAALQARGMERLRAGLERSDRSLLDALRRNGPAFVLECKAASPSRGRLAAGDYDPVEQARAYGPFADAISVLADAAFFGGSPDDVRAVRAAVDVPVLYKDVIIDPVQVVLARQCDADAVLLMASVLDDDGLRACAAVAAELGLDVLAEAHDADELERVVALGFPIIGINNRDLQTLEVDLTTLRSLAAYVPADRVLICESGISSRADVVDNARHCDGFLIGGVLNVSRRPDLVARELVFGRTKVCGLTRPADATLAYELGATDGGLILSEVSTSARKVDLARAAAVIAAAPMRWTGVFVDDELDRIVEACEQLDLRAVQLHGSEDEQMIRALAERLPGVELVAVQRMAPGSRVDLRPLELCDRLLLDAFVPGMRGGTGRAFDLELLEQIPAEVLRTRVAIAGGVGAENIADVARLAPAMIEVNSGVESAPGEKSAVKLGRAFDAARELPTREAKHAVPNGRFGAYGGAFVPQILVPALRELTRAFEEARRDPAFETELRRLLRDFAGRPTPLYQTTRLDGEYAATILLKREDLVHGGAHKTNQVLAQALLAKRLGKTRLIAETGAGQHGVATAMVAALFGFECVVYMGAKDVARQQPNVQRMRLMGAEVRAVGAGEGTLKEAINEAMRDWAGSYGSTHYVLGTVAGPHPYPTMVRDFQRVIGDEARQQCIDLVGRLPDVAVACVGGGSNAIGLFTAFLGDDVELVGVEPYGHGLASGKHGATLGRGRPGVLHGSKTYLLQDDHGQIAESHSISAGLDYPGIGPEHAALKDSGRVRYDGATDDEALAAFMALTRSEGIIPALESSHALAYALRRAAEGRDEVILVNLSGRGDKDLATVLAQIGGQ